MTGDEAHRETELQHTDHLVVDTIEGDLARVEWEGRLLDLPLRWLPDGAQPGDHVHVHHANGRLRLTIDAQATRTAQNENQATLDRLNATDDGKDLQL